MLPITIVISVSAAGAPALGQVVLPDGATDVFVGRTTPVSYLQQYNVYLALQSAAIATGAGQPVATPVLVQTIGADGGHGGDKTLKSGGTGDDGQTIAGQMMVRASGTLNSAAGDNTPAIRFLMTGGNGGRGGHSYGGAHGGSGGNGGPAGAIGLDLVGPGTVVSTAGAGSPAVYAEALAGNGGNGGNAYGVDGYGQHGGVGGYGGTIWIGVAAGVNLSTTGAQSTGIIATSAGGSGGGGGDYDGIHGSGGGGQNGGGGGTVTVVLNGGIVTTGNGAIGILAQSFGGSSGQGGSLGAAGGHGGPSGQGGGGGSSVVTLGGTISTTGDNAHGIIAKSVGGNSAGAGDASAAFDATGGAAGASGPAAGVGVNLLQGSAIDTRGAGAVGVVAQALGGDAGSGGSTQAAHSVAGKAGTGGDGYVRDGSYLSRVQVTASGRITTAGDGSQGILAESIGGSGGSGGSASGVYTKGGRGGIGGAGGPVVVALTGTGSITTSGASSSAIVADSIGGGGGSGGRATSAGPISVAIGGKGGAGGQAGSVQVTNAGALKTSGANADGIDASSIGGGGGRGGAATSISVNVGGPAVDVAIGGSGGQGGSAAEVAVSNAGTIATLGDGSRGVVGQSIGGGGGHGGTAIGVSISASPDPQIPAIGISIALGGSGGTGGNGGSVTVGNTSRITTAGSFGSGVLAESVGGGGGSGGNVVNVAVSAGVGPALSLSVGLGGSGANAGSGGVVSVTNSGAIATSGPLADGIDAQSIGGGGGIGGSVVSATASLSRETAIGVNVAVGGTGGTGNNGGDVTVQNAGSIVTSGVQSYGVFGQSVGGGGGRGGHAETYTLAAAVPASGASGGGREADIQVAVGGSGGAGGNGGSVTVGSTGQITTSGNLSTAILAQSIGGGGGAGGHAFSATLTKSGDATPKPDAAADDTSAKGKSLSVTVDVGGNGGTGGTGGTVAVVNAGTIVTTGHAAGAVLAQSIGGGGGIGGSTDALKKDSAVKSYAFKLSLGGNDADGATGGTVSLTNTGIVSTAGALSIGLHAQSIGGGGGIAGHGETVSLSTNGKNALSLAIGGKAGNGADGGAVGITNSGTIATYGAFSHAIKAESIGGGGGTAGSASTNGGVVDTAKKINSAYGEIKGGTDYNFTLGGRGPAGGDGGAVTVGNIGQITVTGEGAMGIFAQSIGGGGGAGAQGSTTNEVAAVIGGRGGSAGDGGAVTVASSGPIVTSGAWGTAILAQSIGGGGGTGGVASDNPYAGRITAGLAIGGQGGGSGKGGAVTVIEQGSILTTGDFATTILAQSVGGGGGIGGTGTNTSLTNLAVGGGGGSKGGNGGDVAVEIGTKSQIATNGVGSAGVIAQSVGGGGGIGGQGLAKVCLGGITSDQCPTLVPTTAAGAAAGDGGKVSIGAHGGLITTKGAFAHGIVAQSLGGGGGIGSDGGRTAIFGANGGSGKGGDITIAVDGGERIVTSGFHAHGIVAQSQGASGAGTVAITLGGRIATSGANSFGIFTDTTGPSTITLARGSSIAGGRVDGAGIRLMHDGTIVNSGAISAASRIAVRADGVVDLTNYGTLTGSVIGATGSKIVNTGSFWSGAESVAIDNRNGFSPGGLFSIGTTHTKSFCQSATGVYLVDVDFIAHAADKVVADTSGTVTGFIKPSILSLRPGQSFEILKGVTSDTLQVFNTPAVTWQLTRANGSVSLSIAKVDFNLPGLTASQSATANTLNRFYTWGQSGGENLDKLLVTAANSHNVSWLGRQLDMLHPGPHAASGQSGTHSVTASTNNLLSCGAEDGPNAAIREGECLWAKAGSRLLDHGATATSSGFLEESYSYSSGAQIALADAWRLGFSAGYEQSKSTGDGNQHGTAERFNVGGAIKYVTGPLFLSVAATYNHGILESSRQVSGFDQDGTNSAIVGTSYTAQASRQTSTASGRLRAAYLFEVGHVFFKPRVDLDAAYTLTHAFAEHGAGDFDLIAKTQGGTYLGVSPILEFGTDIRMGERLLRPFAEVGVTFARHEQDLIAHLRGAGPEGGTVIGLSHGYGQYLDLAAGLSIFRARESELKLRLDGLWGDATRSRSASIKYNLSF